MRGRDIISTVAVLIALQAHKISSTLNRKLEAMREMRSDNGRIFRSERRKLEMLTCEHKQHHGMAKLSR
ncbi:hypothetical protein Plhal304r1_c009g0034441 [Plasmopara halstedii]